MKKPIVLMVLDGMALGTDGPGNAFKMAKKPHLELLFAEYPWTMLDASGEAVGLPEGQMGNSEVGHLNLGAGRIVYQSLTRVNIAIKDGSFKDNPAYNKAFEHVKKHNTKPMFSVFFPMEGSIPISSTSNTSSALRRKRVSREYIFTLFSMEGMCPRNQPLPTSMSWKRLLRNMIQARSRRCREDTMRWTATRTGAGFNSPMMP